MSCAHSVRLPASPLYNLTYRKQCCPMMVEDRVRDKVREQGLFSVVKYHPGRGKVHQSLTVRCEHAPEEECRMLVKHVLARSYCCERQGAQVCARALREWWSGMSGSRKHVRIRIGTRVRIAPGLGTFSLRRLSPLMWPEHNIRLRRERVNLRNLDKRCESNSLHHQIKVHFNLNRVSFALSSCVDSKLM